ncbi:TonB-dependent receptor [Mucilaginibacter paludis]|nr:TonB-dependent receptor [Mucilaginibacter paludis]
MARFTFLVLVVSLTLTGMLLASTVKSQNLDNVKVSLHFNEAGLDKVLSSIEQQSGFTFTYAPKLLTVPVTIDVKEASMREVLKLLSQNQKLQFTQVNWTLTVNKIPPPVIGFIEGVVIDAKTKETLIGATISVSGTTNGTQTDINGHFKLSVNEGNYDLDVKYIGYVTKHIKGIQIKGKQVTLLNLTLEASSNALSEVVIQARRRLISEAAVLNERKKSATVEDLISTRNIEKTASITTTQALQRVSGVTVTNDKYVSIRGLGDRNVIGTINGARITNANADNNSVPLDLIPAGLLDNIAVFKTLTPDKPADAAAGIVELRTKSFPDTLTLVVSAQNGSNSTVGYGGQINSFYNSDLGFLGQNVQKKNLSQDFINLANEFPGLAGANGYSSGEAIRRFLYTSGANVSSYQEALHIDKIQKSFDPVLTTSYKTAQPNQTYNLAFGNSYKFGKQTIGIVAGLNYFYRTEEKRNTQLNNYSIYQGVGFRYPFSIPATNTANHVELEPQLTQTENTGLETLNYGGLFSIGYRPMEGQEITLNYIGNKAAEAQGSNLFGEFPSSGTIRPVLNQVNSLRQEERTLNTYQARGAHKLGSGPYATQIDWNASISKGLQNDPDYRFTSVVIDSNYYDYVKRAPKQNFYAFLTGTRAAIVAGGQVYDPNNRAYRTLNERNQNYQVDLSQPFKALKQKQLFKTGFYYLNKQRDYHENIQTLPSSAALFNAGGDLNKMISADQIGLENGTSTNYEGGGNPAGFVYQLAKSTNNYSGSSVAKAAYGMLDLHITPKLRLVGGVRFEKTDIHALIDTAGTVVTTSGIYSSTLTPTPYRPDFNPNINYKTSWVPYYSANMIYSPKENINIRFAYSSTLARPELRELIPVTQYDPFQFAIVTGNPNLQNQRTNSFDLRTEWFSGKGEVISISVYDKTIHNQLTKAFSNDSTGTQTTGYNFPQVKYYNDTETGHVMGIELEARKDLGTLTPYLKNFFIGANILLANSYIQKNAERLAASRTIDNSSPGKSPLEGQPPYSLNVSLDYDNPKTGTSITSNFNIIGERLVQVVLTGEPDIYDRPAPVLDFVLAQKLFKRWVIKGYAKNVLNPAYKEVYTNYGNGGKYFGQEYIRRSYYRGADFMLGVSYSIF